MEGYVVHPAILDACMHVMLHVDISLQFDRNVVFVPAALERFILYRRDNPSGNWFSHIRLQQWTPGRISPLCF